uniref:Uncharacterized protein n=1 Tax=Syphacia muris TaxID=451379 RepID=A0A0N5AEC7_9BILA
MRHSDFSGMASTKHRVVQNLPTKKRVEQITAVSLSDFYSSEDAKAFSLSWEFLEQSFMERTKIIKSQIDGLAVSQLSLYMIFLKSKNFLMKLVECHK